MNYTVLADAIAAWMRDYAAQARAKGYVVGLSGGVDSAVTAALAVRAVGVDHVLAVWLPCHSLPEDEGYARMTAQALGLDLLTVDLCATFDTFIASVPKGMDIARANIKPRLRMTAWYYLAQSNDYLVAGTGNRPEMMAGYFTKYGDGGVDIEPLGELYKHEVRVLARVLGVPEPVITRAPTAGLWPGQTDEGDLGITYAELDSILAAMAEGRAPDASEAAVSRVQRMVEASAHKRALPPIFHVERP
jgi:NAD+ synthase